MGSPFAADSSRRRWLQGLARGFFLSALSGLSACAVRRDRSGQKETRVAPEYLAKTDIDRIFDNSREEIMISLFLLAEKLYRRNPREWRKAAASLEEALGRLKRFRDAAPQGIGEAKESAAILLAFTPNYAFDRVAAFLYGLLSMVDAAYEHREEFFFLDSLEAQKLYNCARNVEIAAWKLAEMKNEAGESFLLSNALSANARNLSFEREFGKIIALLDFVARVVEDRNGRAINRVAQSLATAVFLPVGFLK
jgi:hypothetical protein